MAAHNQPLDSSSEIVWAKAPDNIQISKLSLEEIADLVIMDLSNPLIRTDPEKMMHIFESAFRKTRKVRTQHRMDRDRGITP